MRNQLGARRAAWLCGLLLICAPASPRAQRVLHWDSLDVEARLDAAGVLHVTEAHGMVFTGDWNGGERIFNLRSRQRLSSLSVERIDPATGARHELTFDDDLDDVDDVAWQDDRTLRWRSRLPSDKRFANQRIDYAIKYRLAGILRHEADLYQLNHDFAFPDRAGAIERFSLRLALDPAWQPTLTVLDRYTGGPLRPGQGFVLAVPLRYSGIESPLAITPGRPAAVPAAIAAMVLLSGMAIAWFFVRERRLGRFATASQPVDAAWIGRNILTIPAEVVGAAWDGSVRSSEVVALIARMVTEGKLSSGTLDDAPETLRLNVDRASLEGQERALVDGLFFEGRTVVSTAAVKAHYKTRGFDPAAAIAPDLEYRAHLLLPSGDHPEPSPAFGALLAGSALILLIVDAFSGDPSVPLLFIPAVVAGALVLLVQFPGKLFRERIDWGERAAVVCLTLPVLLAALVGAFLWYLVSPDEIDLSTLEIAAIALLAVWVVQSALQAMKSRQNPAALAFRKTLAAGRSFFRTELQRERPSLQDSWYPWVLAYGLGDDADRWSTRHASRGRSTHASTATAASSSDAAWTGAAGGKSGGAGGGAGWAAAASGMAAGVAVPSSSGGSSSGGGGGSSGGGGGGGW